MFTTHLGMVYTITTYKNGDLGDGLLLFYHVLPTLWLFTLRWSNVAGWKTP